MTIHTMADFTPGSSATQLTTNKDLSATWIQVTVTGNSIRYGDANITSSRGAKIPASVLFNIVPRDSFDQSRTDLSTIYFIGNGSDTVSITYGD